MKHSNYTYQQAEKDIKEIVKRIKIIEDERGFKFKNIYPIQRGGLYLGLRLSHLLGVSILQNCNRLDKNTTIITEDVIDEGKTLYDLRKCFIVCFHYKPHSRFKPKLYIHKTNDWIHYFWEDGSIALSSERSVKLLKKMRR